MDAAKDEGGQDNITVVLVSLGDGEVEESASWVDTPATDDDPTGDLSEA